MRHTSEGWCETRDKWKRKMYRKFVNICGATPHLSQNYVLMLLADLGQGSVRLAYYFSIPSRRCTCRSTHARSVATVPRMLTGLHADALANIGMPSSALVQAQVLLMRASLRRCKCKCDAVARGYTVECLQRIITIAHVDGACVPPRTGLQSPCPLHRRSTCQYLSLCPFVNPTTNPQEVFARSIRPLAQLRTLSLSIVPSPGEDSLQSIDTCLVLSSPRLSSVTITFLSRNSTNAPHTGPANGMASIRELPASTTSSVKEYRFLQG